MKSLRNPLDSLIADTFDDINSRYLVEKDNPRYIHKVISELQRYTSDPWQSIYLLFNSTKADAWWHIYAVLGIRKDKFSGVAIPEDKSDKKAVFTIAVYTILIPVACILEISTIGSLITLVLVFYLTYRCRILAERYK